MDPLEAMKAEVEMMREEKIRMEARLISVESALAENKRVVSEYKAMKELADNFLDVVVEAGGDNVDKNNSHQNLDEETMKGLIEETMRDFIVALNEAQSPRSSSEDGRNGGGYDGSAGETTILNLDHTGGTNINIVNEARGGNQSGNGGGQAE